MDELKVVYKQLGLEKKVWMSSKRIKKHHIAVAYPGGFSGCPETPPTMIFFNQGGDTVTGTDPDRPLTFATFGNPPSDQLCIRHCIGGKMTRQGNCFVFLGGVA